MSNIMTPDRIAALTRLREAAGKDYEGCDADAYEMFLVVDECFRCCETEEVATWLPYVPGLALGDGEFIFAMRANRGGEIRRVYRVWTAAAVECVAENVIDWYMPLSPNTLPAMKIQEVVT